MAISSETIFQYLPIEQQQAINFRSQELIKEYQTLQELRKAHQLTQEEIAQVLGIRQDSVSKLEKRTDLLLSTLRNYIQAMGGNLELRVEFPDAPPVILTGLSDLK